MTSRLDLTPDSLGRAWTLVLVRGLTAIAFGVLALASPGPTLVVLLGIYGIYAVIDGLLALFAALRGGGVVPRWWLALAGAAGFAAGAIALLAPGVTTVVLAVIVGIAAIVRGVLEIIGAIQMRERLHNDWVLILSGATSLVFGAAIVFAPGASALILIGVIGVWAIALGALLVVLALRLRKRPIAGTPF